MKASEYFFLQTKKSYQFATACRLILQLNCAHTTRFPICEVEHKPFHKQPPRRYRYLVINIKTSHRIVLHSEKPLS